MSSTPGVFISYRRQDSQSAAGRLADHLKEHLRAPVFRDVETIEPGVDFVEAIEKALASCAVMLVVIGPRWVSVTDAAGRRRLDDPNDYTRLEVGTALKRNVRVIPVLVEGATMPAVDELPEELKSLARRNAIELSDKRWGYDVAQLVETVHKVLGDVGLSGSSLERVKQVLTEPERMTDELARSMGLPGAGKPAAAATRPGAGRRRWWIAAAIGLVIGIILVALEEQPGPPDLNGLWQDQAGVIYPMHQQGERVAIQVPGPLGTEVWQGTLSGDQLTLNYEAPGRSLQATFRLSSEGLLHGVVQDRLTGQQARVALRRQSGG